MSKAIGLDLGTGNLCLGTFEGGKPVVIVNSEGKRTTPSMVGFGKDGERKFGEAAKRQAVTNPKRTVYSIKRFMGQPYEKVADEIKRVTYDVVDEGGYPKVSIEDRKYTPQEISAIYIQNMKKYAEDYLGDKVTDIVITVPAYFDNAQRQATKEAGEIAGLNVLRIINEPTAAALAYGLDKSDKDMKVAVFDSGQGTFDISILSFGGGVFEVLSTNGDTHLGGDDFDRVIVDWLVREFINDEGADLSKDPMAMQRLKEAAEKAKVDLSSSSSAEINLPYITSVENTPKHLVKTITRATFEHLSNELFERHKEPCLKALRDAKVDPSEIDEVILVGGSTRIPKMQDLVRELFGKEPSKSVNPDEAVALGASVQAAILSGENGVGDIVLLDVTPLNLGIETAGGVMTTLIEANTTIPCDREETFTTMVDNQPEVTVNLLQGDRPMASQNKSLGRFNLTGILPAKRGVPKITVKVSINSDGIIEVSAKDRATNKEQSIRVEGASSLSKEEIERMRAEAVSNAESDKKVREEADAVNKGDNIIFSQEKMMEEQKDKLSEEDKEKLNGLISNMKEAVKDRDVSKINSTEAEINTVWNSVAEKLYGSGKPFADGNFFGGQGPFSAGGPFGGVTDSPFSGSNAGGQTIQDAEIVDA